MTEENSGKNRSNRYHARWITQFGWTKMAKNFSVNSLGNFLSCQEASRRVGEQAGKQVDFSPQTDTFHSFG